MYVPVGAISVLLRSWLRSSSFLQIRLNGKRRGRPAETESIRVLAKGVGLPVAAENSVVECCKRRRWKVARPWYTLPELRWPTANHARLDRAASPGLPVVLTIAAPNRSF